MRTVLIEGFAIIDGKEMVTTIEKRQEISFDDFARISGPSHFIDVLKENVVTQLKGQIDNLPYSLQIG